MVDSFDVSSDEFTREQYREVEREALQGNRVDGPGSLEPFEQTLMRMILEARQLREAWCACGDRIEPHIKGARCVNCAMLLENERDAALADREEMRRRLKPLSQERDAAVDCYDQMRAERDTAVARVASLEADADRCGVLETSCANCAKMAERMHGLEESLAALRGRV